MEIEKKRLAELDPIIVYTIGKVGSTTVMRALQSVGVRAHRCYDGNIADYYIARESLVVTMMREPIEWAISVMFENAATHPKPGHIINWFQNEFRQATGFNLFGQPFKKTKGYRVFSKRCLAIRTDKLSQSLAIGLSELLGHWVSDPPEPDAFTVGRFANGSQRHGLDYAEFIETYKLPKKYLEDLYLTQYFKQFFTLQEKKEFIEKWSNK